MQIKETDDVLIFSGEDGSAEGTFERYYGIKDKKAIRSRLSRERCHGDRWASVWVRGVGTVEDVYVELDSSLVATTGRMRRLPGELIRENLSAQLAARRRGSAKAREASARNGKKSQGRPKKGQEA